MQPYKLLALILTGCASLLLGILPSLQFTEYLFINISYYIILTLFVFWLLYMFMVFCPHFKGGLKRHYPAVLISIGITILIFFISSPRYKILADEANLVGVSMMMFENRTSVMPIEGDFSHVDNPGNISRPDKRPLFFSFCVSLVHAMIGYNAGNGFVLNFIVSCATLFLFYISVIQFLPRGYGFISLLLFTACPIYMICTTSSGFELLNLMFLIFTFTMLNEIAKSGGSNRQIELLFLTAIIVANCRYESALLLPVICVVLLPSMVKQQYFRRMTWVVIVMPVFFLPSIWQRRLFSNLTEFNRISPGVMQSVDKPFKISHLLTNFDDNVFVLLGLNPNYGFSPLVALLAIIGAYFLIKNSLLTRKIEIPLPTQTAAALSFVALFILISSYFWGNFGIHMDNRLALVFLPFLIWCGMYLLNLIFKAPQIKVFSLLLIVAMVHLAILWPYGVRQQIIKGLALQYEYNSVLEVLRTKFGENDRILLITELPNLYVIHNYSGIQFNNMKNLSSIVPDLNKYDHILALQRFDWRSGRVLKNSILKNSVRKTTLSVIPVSTQIGLRISECFF